MVEGMSVVVNVMLSLMSFTNHVGTGGVFDVCLCLGCGGVGGEWLGDQGLEGWCYLCVKFLSGFSV